MPKVERCWVRYGFAYSVCAAWLNGGCAPAVEVKVGTHGDLVTSEAGKSVELAISLTEAPRGSVVVSATSSDPSEASTSAPVRFDATNWSEPQILRVTGVDDAATDGDVSYQVVIEATVSSRFLQQHELIDVLSFVNQDNEIARFVALGDLVGGDNASYVTDMSDSGEIVVGWSPAAAGDEATLWTPSNGLMSLGGMTSQAHGVSPNGQLTVGSAADTKYGQYRTGVIWRGAEPLAPLPAYLLSDGTALFVSLDADVVLDNGEVWGTCMQHGGTDPVVCHVSVSGELSAGDMRHIYAADGAGHTVGVRYPGPHGGPWASRAIQTGLLSYELGYPAGSICVEPHACESAARAFSSDPPVVVGTSRVPAVDQPSTGGAPLFDTAFLATESEGMQRLRDLADGDEGSAAYALALAGHLVAGFGTNGDGKRAVVWIDRQPRLLSELVAEAGGAIPPGFVLNEVVAMSVDGRTFAGNGTNAEAKPEGFRVTLPSAPRGGFAGLGDLAGGDIASYATAVSAAGDVVVGFSRDAAGDEAVRWTAAAGLQGLGGPNSQAHGVSPDGQIIVGSVAESSYLGGRAAALWRTGAAYELIPGPFAGDGTPIFWVVDANAVRGDGRAFGTCIQYNAYGDRLRCYFDASGEFKVDGVGEIFAGDAALNYAGTSYPGSKSGNLFGSVAIYDGDQLGYPAGSACLQPHSCRSEARAFSAGGGVIVGTSQVPAVGSPPVTSGPLFDTAFVYTSDEGMLRLPDLAEGDDASGAFAIDSAGRVIGGFGSDADGAQAVLWVDRKPLRVIELLKQAQIAVPAGWKLRQIRAISADGSTLVGNGVNPDGNPEAFRVVLPAPPTP
jgi:uncharacterized membrane protein